ncbi:hypothetical protein M422DRAFT_250263 [Sphaerobolus stellatus SS14]|uniref:Uncharacterized protein n=1 Tax=Sphaerobolus stellatus (strain SS14) TaxID=990650 RepID=A0A0C9VGR4_SPHS4|nr:hypothetical protein M422DRAFT_250263 [Sphaerobolus stellatus SS14]
MEHADVGPVHEGGVDGEGQGQSPLLGAVCSWKSTTSVENEINVGILLVKSTPSGSEKKVRRPHISESCHSTGSPSRFGHAASSSINNVLRIIGPSGKPLRVLTCEPNSPSFPATAPTSSTHTTSADTVRVDSFDYGASERDTIREKTRGRSEDLRAQTLDSLSPFVGGGASALGTTSGVSSTTNVVKLSHGGTLRQLPSYWRTRCLDAVLGRLLLSVNETTARSILYKPMLTKLTSNGQVSIGVDIAYNPPLRSKLLTHGIGVQHQGVITGATSPPPHPPLKAWLTVRRTFEATPQSYTRIVRGILNGRSTAERRAEDSYLAVLKDHILYLYDGDAMQECAAAIDVRSYPVRIYPEKALLNGLRQTQCHCPSRT